eukprot:TRINITY_DN1444_c0_g2_i1.p1 TRINITY_DN1444_c0_g2~~TRINITY_DN1444_c0_g2_i1.p1  ORF type:complete len:436 (+),score=75.08 TRINITY_DN1444_c0_g2_i1:289-1596(+)
MKDQENIDPQVVLPHKGIGVLSPVSALSQTLQEMKTSPSRCTHNTQHNTTDILNSPPPNPLNLAMRFRTQLGSTRRRLSLSYDSMMVNSSPNNISTTFSEINHTTIISPPKFSVLLDTTTPPPNNTTSHTHSNNLSPESPCFDIARRSSISPYKTPSKKDTEDEDEDDSFITSPYAKHSIHQDIRFARAVTGKTLDPSSIKPHPLLPQLRRSSSDMSAKKRLPRPWASISMSTTAETPLEWIKKSKMDAVEKTVLGLPTVPGSHPDLNCIDPVTVASLIDGAYKDYYSSVYIIDCRFPYEYEGGHIRGAINLCENELKKRFIDHPLTEGRICLIFHCEFSSKRAPSCYRLLRGLDRKVNYQDYPKLYYNDIYLLEGGYKRFFEEYSSHCEGGYVLMRDEQYLDEMKDHIKQRAGLKRSRSFSFNHLVSTSVLAAR